jgi:glucose/arabinose dehydrogenase
MNSHSSRFVAVGGSIALGASLLVFAHSRVDEKNVVTGKAAFTSFATEKPGTFRKITVEDLPKPYETQGVGNPPHVIPQPQGAWPLVPEGFKVERFVEKLAGPRKILRAPNGDMFVAESDHGSIEVYRGMTKDGKPEQTSVFASGLTQPFGIAFYPVGKDPQWVYIGDTNAVLRFAYKNGDLKASGDPETIVSGIPRGGHWTRDVVFSKDGTKMFVAVGSGSNVDDPDTHPKEFHRANILEYTPEGKFVEVYGAGIRNPVGLAINPTTGQLWCSVNERDMLGDNLVPDYITHVQEGGFYGWPWYYMGNHHDPRLEGKHPELASKVIVPDVLLQPHNASLELMFYGGKMFPKQYRGDIFASEHGSWNKKERAGYELIRVPLDDGKANGAYEDFMTGFVTADGNAWGRPVGVASAPDGSLLVTDDGSNSIWRITYTGKS